MIQSRICEMLGIEYPVFQGGMAWIADGRLAAAVSNGGGLGIIGAGNIGRALAGYKSFAAEGFKVRALFDIEVREPRIGDIPVYNIEKLSDYVKENGCDIAVIATQKSVASDVANQLVALGVKSLWNFAPIDLEVPDDVSVENIAMSESLYVLSYRMKNKNKN